MNGMSSLLLIPILTITVVLSLSVSNVYALTNVNNTYFSINVPDNWTYIERSNTIAAEKQGYGLGNKISLVPHEFADLLLNDDGKKRLEIIGDKEGAIALIEQDSSYSLKNAPVKFYVKYMLDTMKIENTTSWNSSKVGGENGIRIDASAYKLDNNNLMKFTIYFVMHNGEAYNLMYVANPKDFQKYLPQFEQMVKTFKFTK